MRRLTCGMFLIATLAAASGQAAPYPVGHWRTQMQGALVEIKICADHSPCGFLAWVDRSVSHGITTDVRNPDPALRSRPLVGVPIIWGLHSSGASWEGGRVYNPETGQIFRSSMRAISDQRLRVTGCWGPLCRSETWVRAENPRQGRN